MVSKEINEIFDIISLARTASYEAMLHSQSNKEDLCTTKMGDVEVQVKKLNQKLKDLKHKIEFLKIQS